MSIYRSRHTAYSSKKVPRKKRAIPLYGEGDYRGKWFKCWNCGFINNIDRNQVASTFNGGDSSQVFEFDDAPPSPFGMANSSVYLTLDNPTSINLMKLNLSGNIVALNTPNSVVITGGCSFCGCLNYR